MHNFKKAICSIIAFLTVVVFISCPVLFSYFSICNNGSNFEEDYNKQNGNINTLFLGSSNTMKSVIPFEFDKQTGLHSYNYTANRMYLYEYYYSLLKICKSNKISKVYIELSYDALFDKVDRVETAVNFISRIPNHFEKIHYLLCKGPECFANVYAYSLNSGLKPFVHNLYLLYDTIRGKSLITDTSDKILLEQGYYKTDSNFHPETSDYVTVYHSASRNYLEAEKKELKYLEKIINFCKAKSIETVFFVVPVSDSNIIEYNNNFVFEFAIKKIESDFDIRVFDFNLLKTKSSIFDDCKDFSNKDHMSHNGAIKFTALLIDFEKERKKHSNQELFYNSYALAEKAILDRLK